MRLCIMYRYIWYSLYINTMSISCTIYTAGKLSGRNVVQSNLVNYISPEEMVSKLFSQDSAHGILVEPSESLVVDKTLGNVRSEKRVLITHSLLSRSSPLLE